MKIIKNPGRPKCMFCKSEDTFHMGWKVVDGDRRKVYRCKSCRHRFTPKPMPKEILSIPPYEKLLSGSYPSRNWSMYNLAQKKEKLVVFKLISDAVDFMCIPYRYKGKGRPNVDFADMVKICCYKVFCNFSARRINSDLIIARALGYIEKVPTFTLADKYMRMESMTPYFERLYKTLAVPVIQLENNFLVDSTGFSTFGKRRWLDARMDIRERRDYLKLHIMSGVMTKVITSAQISEGTANDSPYFEILSRETAQRFTIRQAIGDAAYLSRNNCAIVEELGGEPYFMVKSNTRRFGKIGGYAWKNMINQFVNNTEEFMKIYHQRSIVESVFSMMKRKFSPHVRSKTFAGRKNEILCKVIAHNASVLCHVIFALNLRIDFELKR